MERCRVSRYFRRCGQRHGPAVALGLFVFVGCVTEPTSYLQVSLTLSDSLLTPSSPLEVEVVVTNYGQKPDRIEGECSPHFRVSEVAGTIVGPDALTCPPGGLGPVALGPGASTTFLTSWPGTDSSGTPLPPAVYGLQGWATPEDRDPIYTRILYVSLREDPAPTP